jgi:hypothetical protein
MKHRGGARRGHLHLGLGLADPGLAQGFAEGGDLAYVIILVQRGLVDALAEGVKVGIGDPRGAIELGRVLHSLRSDSGTSGAGALS